MRLQPTIGNRLRLVLVTLAAAAAAACSLGGIVVWSGLYDVAASVGHPPPIQWLLHLVMKRSVAAHAPQLTPPNLEDPRLIQRGALHFATGCAPCHGAPGQLASPIAQQMTPVPPGLYGAWKDFDPSELFWIIQNGVKLTAMPAWPAHERSDEIWAMVAFVEQLRAMKTSDYLALANSTMPNWLPAVPPGSNFNPAACAGCHGDEGQGRAGIAPAIAGGEQQALEAALDAYRDGTRLSGFMQPPAAQLSDAQIAAAARYYASLRSGEAQ